MKGHDILPRGEIEVTPEIARQMSGRCNLPDDFSKMCKDDYEGQRCVILANGPSLPSAHDLARIDCSVIGINRSFLRRSSDIHIVVDKMHVGSYGHLLRDLMPNTLVFTRYAARGCLTPLRLHYQLMKNLDRPLLPDIVTDGWIIVGAGMAALQIAVWLGFKEIIFCGLDLRRDGEHFYDEPPWMVSHLSEFHATVLEVQRDYLQLVRPELDRRNIKVISTTMDAGEHVLTKVRFDALWPEEAK